jgi:hypothetical protein
LTLGFQPTLTRTQETINEINAQTQLIEQEYSSCLGDEYDIVKLFLCEIARGKSLRELVEKHPLQWIPTPIPCTSGCHKSIHPPTVLHRSKGEHKDFNGQLICYQIQK